MPTNIVYTNNLQGSVIMTGNTVQIYNQRYTVGLPTCIPPNGGSISGNPASNYINSSSSAQITIPNASTVQKAYLTWGGYNSSVNNGFNIPTAATLPITFIDPSSVAHTINPQNTLTFTDPFGQKLYTQTVDVTTIVSTAGSGFYTAKSVPIVFDGNGSSGGFILYIVYENKTEPFRNITIWSTINFIQGGVGGNVDFPISGFITPSTGAVNGKIIVAAANGDAGLPGDFMQFGRNTSSLQTLSGPNNPPNNFFCSQINDNNGNLNKTGTWGNSNVAPGANPTTNNRVEWDVTRVSANPGLTNNQTTGVIRLWTISDTYAVTGLALQVDINSALLVPLTKSVSKSSAVIGDILTYTIASTNSGATTALNVVFIDTIPAGTTFVDNSLNVNGVTLPGQNPNPPGVTVPDIGPSQNVTITFKVSVNGSTTIVNNQGNFNYDFNPGLGTTLSSSSSSNIVSTTIVTPILPSNKYGDKSFVNLGDNIIYTISIANSLTNTAVNIVFIDTIPAGTTFVQDSLTVNGNALTGQNPNPPGITIPDISPGQSSTITFEVNVTNTIPFTNPINNKGYFNFSIVETSGSTVSGLSTTNTFTSTISTAIISSTKIVDKNFADLGTTLNYSIPVVNSGSTTAENIVFIDTVPSGTTFVTGSLKQDLTTVSGNPNPPGATLPNSIGPNGVSTITFSVVVNTIPTINPIPNSATQTYNFIVDSTTTPNITGSGSSNSNTVYTQINNADLKNISKSLDKTYAKCGDIITYIITIPNTGNTTAQNIILIDTIPNGTILVPNSVSVNGTTIPGANPNLGVSIPNIGAGGIATLTFKVIINC